jgi:hypothetical protein
MPWSAGRPTNTLLTMTDDKSPVPELRASHEDRDRIAEQLRVAAGDGRLTVDELDERLEKALSARTGSELAALVTDLPAARSGSGLAVPQEAKDLVQIEVSSGSVKRDGKWVLPRAATVTVGSGSATLDLTQAVHTGPTLQIQATVRSGGLTIITRPGIEVVMDDVKVSSGSAKVRRPQDAGSVPTVLRVEVSGEVRSGHITARPPRRGFVDWLLRRPVKYGS